MNPLYGFSHISSSSFSYKKRSVPVCNTKNMETLILQCGHLYIHECNKFYIEIPNTQVIQIWPKMLIVFMSVNCITCFILGCLLEVVSPYMHTLVPSLKHRIFKTVLQPMEKLRSNDNFGSNLNQYHDFQIQLKDLQIQQLTFYTATKILLFTWPFT
jgi:hypothetical protein